MVNIWGLILQSLQVSVIASVLLMIKSVFNDKMPPLWQYNVWWVLAIGMILPAGINNFHIAMIPAVYILNIKTQIETALNSRYTNRLDVVYNTSFIPVIKSVPKSITDILFVIYVCGVIILLLRYMMEYFRLGKVVSAAYTDKNMLDFALQTGEKYGVGSCKVKVLKGLPSPFVFGVFRPVLIMPEDKSPDEKVILHELLHLKYFDLQQKVFWSFFRALHWINPFMMYVFRKIDNDIESLRDNRVLQLLKGEERRDYGRVLLGMTNKKYPSAFGTSSISNGSRFIAQRIETIARFKKYPKGMKLAGGCIMVLLISLVFPYNKNYYAMENINIYVQDYGVYKSEPIKAQRLKLETCPTVAGALDVFFGGTVYHREIYLNTVNPAGIKTDKYTYPDDYFSGNPVDRTRPFSVLNLLPTGKNSYSADIMIKTQGLDSNGGIMRCTNYYILPVNLEKQNGSWKVWQIGEAVHYFYEKADYSSCGIPLSEEYDRSLVYNLSTPYGEFDISVDNVSEYKNENGIWFPYSPVTNGVFTQEYTNYEVEFSPSDKLKHGDKISIVLAELDNPASSLEISNIDNTVNSQREKKGYLAYHAEIDNTSNLKINRRFEFTNTAAGLPPAVQIEIWKDKTEKIYSFKFSTEDGDIIG